MAEARQRLVGEPQAELGAAQPAVGHAGRDAAGDGVEQGVLPVQQQGALAFALGADVLDQREQPVGGVDRVGALAGADVGLGHDLQRQVHRVADQHRGRQGQPGIIGQLFDAVEQAALELARAAADQVDRYADAGVHVADHALPGDQRVDVARGGREHLAQPVLHRGLEPVADLLHRQEPARTRVGHHPAVEVVGHVRQRALGHPGEQRRDLRPCGTQQRPPGIGQLRVIRDGGAGGFVVLGTGGGLFHSSGGAGGPRILTDRASR